MIAALSQLVLTFGPLTILIHASPQVTFHGQPLCQEVQILEFS